MNIGRDRVIDTALLRALRKGWIGGAGLDVHSQTLLPANSAFFDLPNVILTPHMSGVTQAYYERSIALFCENVRRYITLVNVADKRREY